MAWLINQAHYCLNKVKLCMTNKMRSEVVCLPLEKQYCYQ